MEIKTEKEMIDFCNKVKGLFELKIRETIGYQFLPGLEDVNRKLIKEGGLSEGSHLQQGIATIEYNQIESEVVIDEIPYLYPSSRVIKEYPVCTGTMTGNLSNCYDRFNRLFLFHMRGKDVSASYYFQAAAAGMSYFREHPRETARKELMEEAEILYPEVLFNGKAVDVLPFMKGGKIPQLEFSFGFSYDLKKFTLCHDLYDIESFEAKIKEDIKNGKIEQREGYHFTVSLYNLERVVGELNDKKRFYGPIYESTINFLRTLKDNSIL